MNDTVVQLTYDNLWRFGISISILTAILVSACHFSAFIIDYYTFKRLQSSNKEVDNK